MYCIKVTPGTERIRVRSISSGFLPSYAPAADPDAPFAFSDADGAFVASSGKKIRKLVVPGYIFSLQRSPRAKRVDPEEWNPADGLCEMDPVCISHNYKDAPIDQAVSPVLHFYLLTLRLVFLIA